MTSLQERDAGAPMRLSQLAQMKFEASVAASGQVRSLSLAGLLIVWLFAGPFFRGDDSKAPSWLLYAAAIALTVGLALDVLQLVSRAALLEFAYRRANTGTSADEDPIVAETPGNNVVTASFFYAKAAALAVGYGFIVAFFVTSAV
jgi:hypothetical protein